MKKIDKNKIITALCSVAGICIILYFVYQIVQMNSNPYKTELALEREFQNSVKTTAFVVRDEEYITAENTTGTVVSIAEDGKRVGNGEDVAVVFKNSDSAAAYVRINELQREIEYYEQLKNRVGVGTNAPSSYTDLIDDACIDFISASREEIGSEFQDSLIDLRDAITARQLAVGEEIVVEAKLSKLQAELVSLKNLAEGYSTVQAHSSGYYIGAVDGYENAIAYKDCTEVTCAQISSLLSSEKQETNQNVMGKLVDSFDWYFLCNVPYNDSGEIEVGKTVSVNVPNTAVGTIKCTVVYKSDKDGEQVAVVLKCNVMNRDVANLRIAEIQIITDDFTGFRINNDAIREENGEKGVYVMRGNIIQFKKINIVYSTEDYSIIEKVDDSSYVRQYDTIITQGVDLYDGKVVS